MLFFALQHMFQLLDIFTFLFLFPCWFSFQCGQDYHAPAGREVHLEV